MKSNSTLLTVISKVFFSVCPYYSLTKGLYFTDTLITENQILPSVINLQLYRIRIWNEQNRTQPNILVLDRNQTYHMPFAGQWNKYMTTFMDQQFAVDTLVTLPSETPYPFTALATVCSLKARTHHQFQLSIPFCRLVVSWQKEPTLQQSILFTP